MNCHFTVVIGLDAHFGLGDLAIHAMAISAISEVLDQQLVAIPRHGVTENKTRRSNTQQPANVA